MHAYKVGAAIYAIVNPKAKARNSGIKTQNPQVLKEISESKQPTVWIHCASLGEYEQGVPIVYWILANTNYDIVISFFSASGYKHAQPLEKRCYHLYLPYDTRTGMNRFVSQLSPDLVLFIKNEWWWNSLLILQERKIPSYLLSSTIRPSHYFIRYPWKLFKQGISTFNAIFVINESSKTQLQEIYDGKIFVAGDTRIDRVLANKSNQESRLNDNCHCVVYGSVWSTDCKYIALMIDHYPDSLHLIYPHELDDHNICTISNQISSTTTDEMSISVTTSLPVKKQGVYVINSMGQLKNDYKYANIAYIGGGFGQGVHNILEAACYSIPTIFGPNHSKSEEAKAMIVMNTAFTINNKKQLQAALLSLDSKPIYTKISSQLTSYFSISNNATERICSTIFNNERDYQ